MIPDKQSFDSGFEVFLADTLESKQIHYNLRYQVYCDEMGFEDKNAFPEQMEFDEWDNHAVHFIVRHKASGHWVGGLRLVFNKKKTFPFEKLIIPYQEITQADRQVSAELSRLCVLREARRFTSRRLAPYGLPDRDEIQTSEKVVSFYNFKNHTRSLMWGLIRAALLYSVEKEELTHWYLLIGPALACFTRREGFEMLQIGDSCEHRGLRTPYQMKLKDILANPFWNKDYKQHYSLYSDLEKDETTYSQRVARSV